jgi:pimeloyl-ACP methyl ester carboxylesterase
MKIITMRIFLVALFAFFYSSVIGQTIEQVAATFEKNLNDPNNIYGHNDKVGKYYDVRGVKIYCEVYGEGQPLLFIHGNSGSMRDFSYQIPFFSKKYKLIMVDSRAQGKSVDKGDSLTYEMMADDFASLLDQMKIDSAYVVGWSDGGINGLLLAMRHPEKVRKLAVTGANLVPDTTAVPKVIWDMVTPTLQALTQKANKTDLEKNELKLFRLLIDQPHISLASLHTISCPTLVIGGDHDVIKEEHTMLIYKNIPKAYLWILPGSGHSTPVVFSEQFNLNVDRFFMQPYREFNGEARFF